MRVLYLNELRKWTKDKTIQGARFPWIPPKFKSFENFLL